MTESKILNLANRLVSESEITSNALALDIATKANVIVPDLLACDDRVIGKISKDYVFGSCLLFATKPTAYQVPFFRALQNKQSAAVRWPRQSGKTFSFGIGANLVILTRANAQVLVISASTRQAQILRRKMQKPLNAMHRSLQNLLYDAIQKTSITAKSGGAVYFESCLSEDSIRGYSVDLAIEDEKEYWPNAEYVHNDIIEPMFNTTNGFAISGSTPKNKKGEFYKDCQRQDYLQLHATIYDARDAGLVSQNRFNDLWQRYQRGEISEATWQTENMAEFYDDVGRLLSHDALVKCIAKDAQSTYYVDPTALKDKSGFTQIVGDFFVGRDLGGVIDYTVVKLFEKANNYYFLRHCKVFELGTPDQDIIDYSSALAQVFTIRNSLTDGTHNPTLAELLANTDGGEVVKFSKPYKQETARIIAEHVGNDKRPGDIVLPPEMPKIMQYIDALNSLNRDTLDTDKGEHSGNSDQFWATALAIRAATEHRHGIIRHAGSR